MMNLKILFRRAVTFANKVFPKFDQVIIQGFPNAESGAVEVANYIRNTYPMPVYFVVSNKNNDNPGKVLLPNIRVINRSDFLFLFKYVTSRYVFFTHGTPFNSFSKRQTVVNMWHGILYKRVGVLNGRPPMPAQITVGTSELTRMMFSKAFGVPKETVFVSGYPRNDVLIRSKNEKTILKDKIDDQLNSFDKIIIWLPTYRKHVRDNSQDGKQDGKEVGNPFYIQDFDVEYFNSLLKEYNTLCIVKPHPMASKYDTSYNLDHLLFVDDEWISQQGITLYQLIGCTDILISDVSSVIIDYILLDQPIVCISADFDAYKATRGFYFEDIGNWIPTQINQNQTDFFNYLKLVLSTNTDPFEEKRKRLKNEFFTYHDDLSTKRLVDYVFEK